MPDRRGSPGLTLAVLGVAAMAFSVLQSLVIPVLPAIGRDLQVSQQAVTWVLTGYLLSPSPLPAPAPDPGRPPHFFFGR